MLPRRQTYVYWLIEAVHATCSVSPAMLQGHESNKIIKGGVLLFSDDASKQRCTTHTAHWVMLLRANYIQCNFALRRVSTRSACGKLIKSLPSAINHR